MIRFNTEIARADWDEAAALWRVTTRAGDVISARVLVSGIGALHVPSIPKLPRAESFDGVSFHSARWRHDYDLTGKRVAVIGTGASAIQFVLQIAPDVAQLHVFQRTAPWILPKLDREIGPKERWMLYNEQGWRSLFRRTARTRSACWRSWATGCSSIMRKRSRASISSSRSPIQNCAVEARLSPVGHFI
jgi:cation diffusion facilitator CzcD-associated flavoprotein CzcO